MLVPLSLTVILSIVVVVVAVSRYLAGPLPSFLSLVVARGSIPSLPQNHLEGSCVALSLKRKILFVPHLYQHWVCVSSSWYWDGIAILCGIHHIHMSSIVLVIVHFHCIRVSPTWGTLRFLLLQWWG